MTRQTSEENVVMPEQDLGEENDAIRPHVEHKRKRFAMPLDLVYIELSYKEPYVHSRI